MTTLDELGPLLDGVSVLPQQEAVAAQAVAALEAGRLEDAVRSLEGAHLGGPTAAISYLLGVAHLLRADVYRAGPAFEAALSLAPDLWPAHFGRALVLNVLQDFEAASEALRRVLQVRAEHVGAIAALARCYNELGKLDRAEALARRGLELAPAHLGLLQALAGTLRKQERDAEAVDVLRRALHLAPGDEASAVALGRSLLRQQRVAEAQPIFEDILQRNSESTGALAGMAEALQAEERLSEAQGYLLRALAAAPDQGWLHLLNARLQRQMQNAPAAEASANMAATLDPLEPEPLRIGIWACREQRHYDDAAAYAERLLVLVNDDPEGVAARSLARILRGEAAMVVGELSPRVVGERTPPDIILALGCAQFALGRARTAADLFVQVLRHREGDPLAQRLLGWAYELVSNPTADALTLLGVRMREPDAQTPGAAQRPSPRGRSDAPRPHTRRLTGPIQPIVEVAVNQLLSPDRQGGTGGLGNVPVTGHAAPVHGMPVVTRVIPAHGMPMVAHATPAKGMPVVNVNAALPANLSTPEAPRRVTGSIPAIAVLSPVPTLHPPPSAVPPPPAPPPVEPGPPDVVAAPVAVAAVAEAEDSQAGAPDVSVLTQLGERDVSDLREVLRRLHRLVSADATLLPMSVQVERLIEDLDQPMMLAILGPKGAGKTSFVNALIGREVIPASTSIAHLLRYGRNPVGRILYRDGRIETVRFQDLTGFLTSNAAELTPEVVQLVEILYPIEELTRASILDVPETALERRDEPLLTQADAVLWLVGVDQAATHWKDASRWLAERPVDAIAIVSRVEGHEPAQIEAAVDRARALLGDRVAEVIPVSALVALAGLRNKNVSELRRSGIARLHKSLKREFFLRSGWIKAHAGRARARKLLAQLVGEAEDRHALLSDREALLQSLAQSVALDRAQVRAEIEEDTPQRLRAAIDGAVDACAREFGDILRENRGAAGREHVLRTLRGRARQAVGDAIERARDVVDARLSRLTEGYMDRLEQVFPIDEGSAQAQRILGLRGLLDSFRQVLLEQSFGRYEAYFEGWIDQSPLPLLFELEAEPAALAPESLAYALRTRVLRLDTAPAIVLTELAEPLFEGVAGFVDESLSEIRAAELQLTKALREPLRSINLRESEWTG